MHSIEEFQRDSKAISIHKLTIFTSKYGLVNAVLESPGIPVTGSPSMLKGYHNSLIDVSSGTQSPLRVDIEWSHLRFNMT